MNRTHKGTLYCDLIVKNQLKSPKHSMLLPRNHSIWEASYCLVLQTWSVRSWSSETFQISLLKTMNYFWGTFQCRLIQSGELDWSLDWLRERIDAQHVCWLYSRNPIGAEGRYSEFNAVVYERCISFVIIRSSLRYIARIVIDHNEIQNMYVKSIPTLPVIAKCFGRETSMSVINESLIMCTFAELRDCKGKF